MGSRKVGGTYDSPQIVRILHIIQKDQEWSFAFSSALARISSTVEYSYAAT